MSHTERSGSNSQVWVVPTSAQVAHLLPEGWEKRSGTITAACGNRFHARSVTRYVHRNPTPASAAMRCYRCKRHDASPESDAA